MIFFVVKRKDRNSLNPQVRASAEEAPPLPNPYAIIAWNEVYDTPDELLQALYTEAGSDLVCLQMRMGCEQRFGLDPLATSESFSTQALLCHELVTTTFYDWTSPMVGNLGNSPRPRYMTLDEQMDHNWSKFVDATTLGKMTQLFKRTEYSRLTRSPRDQARIFHNITELARAFVGEVTCAYSRRIEKVLALRLCRSQALWRDQAELLLLYLRKRQEELEVAIQEKGIPGLEYGRYYFDGCPPLHKSLRVDLLRALLNEAAGLKLKHEEDVALEPYLDVWSKLPPVIRCTVLLNDIRKLDSMKGSHSARTVMGFCQPPSKLKPSKPWTEQSPHQPYLEGDGKGHVPTDTKTLSLAWSWTRNEYALNVITYRSHLIPLWGGSSGHTIGGLDHWLTVLGGEAPPTAALTIASSLFTLWKLYYDKRISAVHTIAETFEATFCKLVTGGKLLPIELKTVAKAGEDLDAYELVQRCGLKAAKGVAVCPIQLMRAATEWIYGKQGPVEGYRGLKALIDRERELLVNPGSWLPRWSKDLTRNTSVAVRTFEDDGSLVAEVDEADLLERMRELEEFVVEEGLLGEVESEQ